MTAVLLGKRRPDLERRHVSDYLASNPSGQPTDIVVHIHETTRDSIRTVLRPATAEEMAQLEVAERIAKASEEFQGYIGLERS